MKRVLVIDGRTLHSTRIGGARGVFSYQEFNGTEDAKAYLRDFVTDPVSMAELRRALAEEGIGREASRMSDSEVIDHVASSIQLMHFQVVEELEDPLPQTPALEGGASSSAPPTLPPSKKLTWIELEVINDETGQPLSWVRMVVKSPDGEENFYTTNTEGVIRIDNVETGTCDARCDVKDATRKDTLRFIKVGKWGGKKADKPTPIKAGVTYRILDVTDHQVKTGENMAGLASGVGSTEPALNKFNFETDKPAEINEAMGMVVGSTKTAADGTTLLFDDADKPGIILLHKKWEQSGLATGSRHTLLVKPIIAIRHVWILELEELHFHHDSAVLLADYDTEDPNPDMEPKERITALTVLAEALAEAKRNPDRKLLIAGHTDTSGSAQYNLPLSQQRADGALAALMGDKTKWVQIALAKHKVEDYQLILKWVARDWGWEGCDPGTIDNKDGPKTRDATKAFQQRYNKEFKKTAGKDAIGEDGVVGQQTWGAFFDVYMTELRELADCDDDAALKALRDNIKFVDDGKKSVGCGENFPKENRGVDDWRSRENRRVEILFFDPNNLPVMDCHKGPCKAAVCQVNDPKQFIPTLLPVEPVLPRFARLRMHMQFLWLDPEKKEHPFPKDMPLFLVYDGGGEAKKLALGENGVLDTVVDRRKQALKIMFDFTSTGANLGVQYMATPPAPAGGGDAPPDTLVKEADLQKAIDDKNRVWRLPEKWTTVESDWTATDAPTYTKGKFTQLADNATTLGLHAKPGKLVLDPHWKYVRFEFYDRFFGKSDHNEKRVRIPSLLLAGWRNAWAIGASPIPPADTESNWTARDADNDKACGAIGFVLQHLDADGSDLPKLNKGMLLRFATKDAYVFSKSATEREIKIIAPGAADLKAKTDRMKLYDLPPVWRSSKYFARLDPTTGKNFDTLTDDEIAAADDPDKMMAFSLDDIVLCRPASATQLTPINWSPGGDRAAIFANTFLNGPNPEDVGPYKPDTANNMSYFSQQVSELTVRNYISDYAPWTRCVIAQGNMFDVFDRRTPEDAQNLVTGARAGVRFVDSAVISGPSATAPTRPTPTQTEFCTIQPFFEQRYLNRQIGRFDLALFRCCGVHTDGTTELGMAMSYFRFHLNFNSPPNAASNPAIGPDNPPFFDQTPPLPLTFNNITAAQQQQWTDVAMRNIPRRWSGPDGGGALNPGPITIRATAANFAGIPLEVRAVWFAQAFPQASRNQCHFDLGIFQSAPTPPGSPAPGFAGPMPPNYRTVRAYMSSSTGIGNLDRTENGPNPTGWFTAAHETGHGGSLPDEYLEPTSPFSVVPSPWLLAFESNMPGGPFEPDGNSMMNQNRQPRPRHFWHVAEWMRFLNGNKDFEVHHGTHVFTLPHNTAPAVPARPYMFTHYGWPMAQVAPKNTGHGRGAFDIFLYPLGDEPYAATVLPGLASAAAAAPHAVAAFDGIIVVVVNLTVNTHIAVPAVPPPANQVAHNAALNQIHTALGNLDIAMQANFNFKWMAAGTVAGHTFNRALLHFQLRWQVPNYSTRGTAIANHFTVNTQAAGASAWQGGATGRTLSLTVPEPNFANFFGNMLGLANGTINTAASYNSLAAEVIPGATVSAA